MAFAPLCQDEKAYPDTTPQKPRLVGQFRLLQRAADKHCSYLVSKDHLPSKIMVIKGSTPDPQRLPAFRHKLPDPTAKSKVSCYGKDVSRCCSGWSFKAIVNAPQHRLVRHEVACLAAGLSRISG